MKFHCYVFVYPRKRKTYVHKKTRTKMFVAALLIKLQMPINRMEKWAGVYSHTTDLLLSSKKKYCYMQRHGWISGAFCWVKDTSHTQKVHIVLFCFYDILQKTQNGGCLRRAEDGDWLGRYMREPSGVTIIYLSWQRFGLYWWLY